MSIAVLVVSCDKYRDLWDPFFDLFRKFWSDCPFPTYLLCNHGGDLPGGVTAVCVGDDTSWSSNLRAGLGSIPEDYVLVLVDDLFLTEKVDTRTVLEACREFLELGGNCLKLNPTVPGDRAAGEMLRACSPGGAYRASTVLTLWRKEVLRDLLAEGETPWEFEIEGTKRSDRYGGFYSTKADCFRFVNGVIKGEWSRSALERVQSISPRPVRVERRVMPRLRELRYQVALARARALYRILPVGADRRILDGLRRWRATWERLVARDGRPR